MRPVTAFCLFVLLSGHHAQAQVFPSSSGGCAMSASGLMDCDWASVIELRGTGKKKTPPILLVRVGSYSSRATYWHQEPY